jgi:hypothetical protein
MYRTAGSLIPAYAPLFTAGGDGPSSQKQERDMRNEISGELNLNELDQVSGGDVVS